MSDPPRCPAYRIVTDRLVIRSWELVDAPLLKAAVDANIEHLRPWMPWVQEEPQPLEHKLALLRRFRAKFDTSEDYVYGVFDREESWAAVGSTPASVQERSRSGTGCTSTTWGAAWRPSSRRP
jgi:RimJ/RimL family protein N-acetyltransferase